MLQQTNRCIVTLRGGGGGGGDRTEVRTPWQLPIEEELFAQMDFNSFWSRQTGNNETNGRDGMDRRGIRHTG